MAVDNATSRIELLEVSNLSTKFWDAWFQGKDFTSDWSSSRFPTWASLLADWVEADIRILEIGSWEGRSAVFFLEYFRRSRLTCIDTFEGSPFLRSHPTWGKAVPDSRRRFDFNVAPYGDRVEIFHSHSVPALFSLVQSARLFDLIYIDGSHDQDDVLMDTLLSWRLLADRGILIWDDYNFPVPRPPQVAIDTFVKMNAGEIEELHRGSQLIVRKKN